MAKRVSGRPRRAFTLIELLVVVAIVALLVSILVPSLGRARELTRRVICATNLRGLGTAWNFYWMDNNYRQPSVTGGGRGYQDTMSQQYNTLLVGSWNNITGSGFLNKFGHIDSPDAYVCPSMEKEVGGTWFQGGWGWPGQSGGNWPLAQGKGASWTTYGLRRMGNYDDSTLAEVDGIWSPDPRTDHIMLMRTSMEEIDDAAGFSLMADCFMVPWIAEMSHPPGVNVLFLDTHVEFYEDTSKDGEVLYYGNPITNAFDYNWEHDDIWMIVGGYHYPPVGQ